MTAKERKTEVHHAERWGLCKAKYKWLEQHDWTSTKWKVLRPKSEFYLFVPQDEGALEQYKKFLKITDIFPVNSVGIVTSRDHLVIDFDKEALKRRIRTFLDPNLSDEFVRQSLKLRDNRDWKLAEKRKLIQQDKNWEKKIVPCLYRPFDVRWLFYHYHAIDFGREQVMRHCIVGSNTGLVFTRQVTYPPYTHALVSDNPIELKAASHNRNTYFAPLYLYEATAKSDLFESRRASQPSKPNLCQELLDVLKANFELLVKPDEVFRYLYAVLYSNEYRRIYEEFLRIDFPRIPFTKDYGLFQKLATLGSQLVELHLLRSLELDPPIARFQGEGDNKVQTGKKGLRYEPDTQRVFINGEQYFEGVPAEVWEYMIGGYQVCRKWLKDRKDRKLALEEIKTYCRIVTALEKTIDIQAEIDTLYPQVEKTLLPIHLESE